jgi:hypothetical protein
MQDLLMRQSIVAARKIQSNWRQIMTRYNAQLWNMYTATHHSLKFCTKQKASPAQLYETFNNETCESAAVLLQSVFRGAQGKERLEQQKMRRRHHAAITLQCQIRKVLVGKNVDERTVHALNKKTKIRGVHSAASHIQSLFRMHKVRDAVMMVIAQMHEEQTKTAAAAAVDAANAAAASAAAWTDGEAPVSRGGMSQWND